MTSNIDLSDSNAWDDSALTDSWNEALREYKKYHSIHVKGQKLTDVLTKEEMDMLRKEGIDLKRESAEAAIEEQADLDDRDQEQGEEDMDVSEIGEEFEQQNGVAINGTHDEQIVEEPSTTRAIPQALLATVQDDGLRNLMMAWYWAGYYTGVQDEKNQQSQTQ